MEDDDIRNDNVMNDQIVTILSDRLAMLETLSLNAGKHDSFDRGHSAMELVSWLAGEPFSDTPQCACPTITAFVNGWNDGLPSDAERNRLIRPLLPCVIGTRSTIATAERRSYLALDWMIRVHAPKWLDLAESLQSHAQRLRDLDEIVDLASAIAAGRLTIAARNAAWAAPGVATGDAAWSAARAAVAAAAGGAARNAAWSAARGAAWAAAWAAALAVAWDAAWAAGTPAARDAALRPTTAWLQASASDLLRRMCEVEPVQAEKQL